MKAVNPVCLVCALLLLTGCGERKMGSRFVTSPGQYKQTFSGKVSRPVSCEYLLFLPEGYGRKQQQWPLMMFLHGAGERGSDLKKVKVHGPPKIVEKEKDFPFILVSPQCPDGDWWTEKVETLAALLDEIEARYDVDKERVYLTGLSMGGYGTWSLACAYPERFAAIVPICGGGRRFMAHKLRDVPVWAFHGGKDPIVPLQESQEMVDTVNRAGGNAKLTIYPDAGHDSWTQAYNNKELYFWLIEHRKSRTVK